VVPRFEAIDTELRQRWPETGRVVLIHRTGSLALGESSVIAVVSAPHRAEAFEAARFAIDALKLSAPIWKHEVWSDGADWGLAAGAPVDAASVPTSSGRRNAS
jgi:molybdopterin synthase catalytic subunit